MDRGVPGHLASLPDLVETTLGGGISEREVQKAERAAGRSRAAGTILATVEIAAPPERNVCKR